MNFRSRNVISLMATGALLLSASFTYFPANAAEPLSVVGPQGQVNTAAKQYGPIQSFDTLWSIAQKVKPDPNLTNYQVMAALFDANPQAFSSSSYSSLVKGALLAIPSQAAMEQYPRTATQSAKTQVSSPAAAQSAVNQSTNDIKPAVSKSVPTADLKQQAEASAQTSLLSSQLQKAEVRNQRLSAEFVKVKDGLVLAQSDNQELKSTVAELNEKVALLNDKLKASLIQNAKQKQALEEAQEQVSTLTAIERDLRSQSVEMQSPTFWQSILAQPWLLAAFASVPALLLIILFWVGLSRRSKPSDPTDSNDPSPSPANVMAEPETHEDNLAPDHAEVSTDSDSTDKTLDEPHNDRAVQLDTPLSEEELPAFETEQRNDYLSSLEAQTEKDTAIDELWAEVIEEHDDEIEADKDLPSMEAQNDEQVDSASVAPSTASSIDPDINSEENDVMAGHQDVSLEADNIVQDQAVKAEFGQNHLDANSYTESHLDDHIPFASAAIADEQSGPLNTEQSGPLNTEQSGPLNTEQSEPLNTDEIEDFFNAKTHDEDISSADDNGQDSDHAELKLSPDLSDKIAAELADELPQNHLDDADNHSSNQDDELKSLLAEFDNVEPIIKTADKESEQATQTSNTDEVIVGLNSHLVNDSVPDEVVKENAAQQAEMADSVSDIDALLEELEDEVVIVDPKHHATDVAVDLGTHSDASVTDEQEETNSLNQELDKFAEENSFIDLNTLLNDEPENDNGRVDPFFESNLDIDELETLIPSESNNDDEIDSVEQSMAAKLDLARAYMDIDDKDSARALLKEVGLEGDEQQRREAGALLNELVGL
ncbi:FimV/HubP family polar landmark protein [uncultured Shewanella sp.]|uniref:FimV/HubP family polar landmark protein n=1 Tax=uncultured Shewanella sp. TaxID=173975 RepID=UPI0026357EBF|nr:FimV/HubP family polar landmark protein [uncultured Shewanella sp.]